MHDVTCMVARARGGVGTSPGFTVKPAPRDVGDGGEARGGVYPGPGCVAVKLGVGEIVNHIWNHIEFFLKSSTVCGTFNLGTANLSGLPDSTPRISA